MASLQIGNIAEFLGKMNVLSGRRDGHHHLASGRGGIQPT